MNNILNLIAQFLFKNKSFYAATAILAIAAITQYAFYLSSQIENRNLQINNDILDSSVELAYSIVAFNLINLEDNQILPAIRKWKNDEWGAQIASLRVICGNDPKKLEQLMSQAVRVRTCRFVN